MIHDEPSARSEAGWQWRVEMLGGLRARRRDGTVVQFRSQKSAALLAYLAYHLRRVHPREELLELFWPGQELDVARHKLSVALSALRQKLEPPGIHDGSVLVAERFSVGLEPGAVATDVSELEATLRAARASHEASERGSFLAAAASLYRGPLLPGRYEEWILPEQARLEGLYLQALRQLSAHHEAQGDLNGALDAAYRAVGADPLREESHRELMRLLAATGQPSAALGQYRDLERILRRELEATPSTATRALAREIESGRVEEWRSGRGEEPAPPAAPSSSPPFLHSSTHFLEPVGGAVGLGSPYYVVRSTDEQFRAAIARRDSIVLIKGAGQVGKTSLLARGLQQAREAGARVVLTDLASLNAAQMVSPDSLLLALADTLADQLDLQVSPAAVWNALGGANLSFRRFLRREVLENREEPVVWGIDDVDRLFGCDFHGEIFALFRSWHNQRALDPGGPWSRLTLAIAYATEAHLFITDPNRSPFNVGTRLELEDFTFEQVADLNRRCGSPLRDASDEARFYRLVGGHPYLVRRGLHEMAAQGLGIAAFEEQAGQDEWAFGDHLRRMASLVARDVVLRTAALEVLGGRPCPDSGSFHRLRSAGVIAGVSSSSARPRCQLYTAYLAHQIT